MSPAVFIDANVPIYAAGGDHPYKEPCSRILQATPDIHKAAPTTPRVPSEPQGVREGGAGRVAARPLRLTSFDLERIDSLTDVPHSRTRTLTRRGRSARPES